MRASGRPRVARPLKVSAGLSGKFKKRHVGFVVLGSAEQPRERKLQPEGLSEEMPSVSGSCGSVSTKIHNSDCVCVCVCLCHSV